MTHMSESNFAGRSLGFLTGLVFGGLAGVATALLLAPRPGVETRRLIRDQMETARDQAALTLSEARHNAEEAVHQAGAKVEQMQDRGRTLWQRNVSRLQETAAAVKSSAQEAWQARRAQPAKSLAQ